MPQVSLSYNTFIYEIYDNVYENLLLGD